MAKNNDYIITFNKPYSFEGKEYTEIDMSKIEEMTAISLEEADKIYQSSGMVDALKEMSISYACIVASKVTGKPLEFFKNLPAKEAIKLKTLVTGFFYN